MDQQTYISLNFEEIFSPLQNEKEETVSQQSSQSAQPLKMYNQNVPDGSISTRPYADTVLTKSTLPYIGNQNSREEFIFREGSSLGISLLSKTHIKRRPKATTTQINAITERLYESGRGSKKSKMETPVKEQSLWKESSAEKKSNNSLKRVKSCQNSFITESSQHEVYDRLYNNSRSKHLRQKYKVNLCPQPKYQNEKVSRIGSKKSLYLSNYTPFYERLDHELNKSAKKANLLRQNYTFLSRDTPSFKPKLIPSKYSRTVQSRYLSSPSKHSDIIAQEMSLNESYLTEDFMEEESEELTVVEQHFFKKMECIFTSCDSEEVQITEEVVQLLTKDQFSLMSVFIMYLQQNPIKKSEFLSYLHSYYHSLSEQEKVYLKHHQAKPKQQYQKLLNSHSRKNNMMSVRKTSPKVEREVLHTFSPQKFSKKQPGNYLMTMERFT